MKIQLNRFLRGKESTIGALTVDGEFYGWTLEDMVRTGPKVYGQTAIPEGTYHVIVNLSPRLKKRYPRLLNVPGFDGILIHKGNDAGDTSGCILVGEHVDSPDRISQCGPVFDRLFQAIDYAYGSGEGVTITIENHFDYDDNLPEWSLQ